MGTCKDCIRVQVMAGDNDAACGRCFLALSRLTDEQHDSARRQIERYREMIYSSGKRDSHRFLICKLMPYWHALRHESRRIRDWRHRHIDGRRFTWLEAWRATVENPPTFDHFWDQEMERRCYCSTPPASCLGLEI